MIFAGCDVGSLTGKAMILQDNEIKAYDIMRVRPRPEQTAQEVMSKTLKKPASLLMTLPIVSVPAMAGSGSLLPRAVFPKSPATAGGPIGSIRRFGLSSTSGDRT
jgi:hypothetical protein